MNTITATNEHGRLSLTKATAGLTEETRDALGRDRCTRTCQEDKAKLWPVTFDLTLTGTFESKKEGRLAVTISLSAAWRKGAKAPYFGERVGVALSLESVGLQLNGWPQQDIVAGMVREKLALSTHIHAAAREAVSNAAEAVVTRETEKAQAHLDRAAAAKGVIVALKK